MDNIEKAVTPLAEELLRSVARAIESGGNVKAVFGEPLKLDGHTVVPVASIFVSVGGGFGIGSGVARLAGEIAGRLLPRNFAGGGGGGLNVSVRPVGFIHDVPDGVAFTAIESPKPFAK